MQVETIRFRHLREANRMRRVRGRMPLSGFVEFALLLSGDMVKAEDSAPQMRTPVKAAS